MPREDVICWLDLETTGSELKSAILEIGMALTDTTPEFNIINEYTRVIRPPMLNSHWIPKMSDVVITMHHDNGLLAEINDLTMTTDLREVEYQMNQFLGHDDQHIPLAGSGVCHFDRQFIRRDFPLLDSRFTYWTYDIGVIRRTLRLCGVAVPDVEKTKTHRALDDVLGDIAQWRQYTAFLREAGKVTDG